MRSVFSKQPTPDPELLHLKEALLTAQGELTLAYRRFDQAVDPELIEACIFEINAVTARCNYLLRAIKEHSPEEPQSAPVRRRAARARRARHTAGGKEDVVWT